MHRRCTTRTTRSLLLGLFVASTVLAQDNPPEPTPEPPQEAAPAAPAGGGGGRGGGGNGPGQGPQPYDRVITKEAKTTKGVFTVHLLRDRYYYEIPKSELGKEFLWNSQIAKTGSNAGYAGKQVSDRLVRWELKANRVLLMDMRSTPTADPKQPIAQAVNAANSDTIIQSFPVAAFAKDGDPVIEVTRLFTGDLQEFSARQALGASGMDANRSFIEHVFPFRITSKPKSRHLYAWRGAGGQGGRGGGGGGRTSGASLWCCITAW